MKRILLITTVIIFNSGFLFSQLIEKREIMEYDKIEVFGISMWSCSRER